MSLPDLRRLPVTVWWCDDEGSKGWDQRQGNQSARLAREPTSRRATRWGAWRDLPGQWFHRGGFWSPKVARLAHNGCVAVTGQHDGYSTTAPRQPQIRRSLP